MFENFNYSDLCVNILNCRTLFTEADLDYGKNRAILAKLTLAIRDQINHLFKDITCKEVIISENIDKEFFGVIVRPICPTNNCENKLLDILVDPNPDRVLRSSDRYILDIDVRLLTNLEIEADQIVDLIIYDIDKIMSIESFQLVAGIADNIMQNIGMTYGDLKAKLTDRTTAVWNFAAYETLYRTKSVFTRPSSEVILVPDIIKAIRGIYNDGDDAVVYSINRFDNAVDAVRKSNKLENDYTCPTLIMNWFFTWLKNYRKADTYAIKLLNRAKDETGSEAMKRAINAAIEALGAPVIRYKNEIPVSESAKKGLVSQMKYSGMKSLEDDLYEYSMRVKNISDENSAILLMRQINSRMGIISDYLESESDKIPEAEYKRWEKLYDKYDKLRDQMVAKPIYSKKMYGLFVDYNALMDMSNPQNVMTMNTMY